MLYRTGFIMLHQLEMSKQKSKLQSQSQKLLRLQTRHLHLMMKVLQENAQDKAKIPRTLTIQVPNMALIRHSGCSQNFNKFGKRPPQRTFNSLDLAKKQVSQSNQEAHRSRKTNTVHRVVNDRIDMLVQIVTSNTT